MSQDNIFRINANGLAHYPPALALSRGLYPGHFGVYVQARITPPTSDVDYTMWGGAESGFADYPFPTSAVKLEIASTSTDDTITGTGMRTILIRGLDANYDTITEVLELNGRTPVITTNNFIRVNFAWGVQAGTGGINAGTIWIADSATDWTDGVPDTNSYKLSIIEAGRGQSAVGVFTAPRGHSVYFPAIIGSASKGGVNAVCDILVDGRGYNEDSVNNVECWRNWSTMGLSGNADSTETFREDFIMLPAYHREDIRMRVNASFTTAPVFARMALVLIKEPQPEPYSVT